MRRTWVPSLLFAALLTCAGAASAGTKIRVVAANLTTTSQKYDAGHGIRIVSALKPDVVLLQECKYKNNTAADVQELADKMCGTGFHVFREEFKGIPNAIFSRWPITASGNWDSPITEDREFAHARIDLPGDKDLFAISLHLKAKSNAKAKREKEAMRLVSLIKEHVPADMLLVAGGDLNTNNTNEKCLGALDDVLTIPGAPTDQGGDDGTNFNRDNPYDWVLANPALHACSTPVQIGTTTHSHKGGLVIDSREFTPLADLPGVLKNDSGDKDMQHMAVVRDFFVP